MHLSHLSLTHFRNYQRLELDLTQRLTLLQGQNAQGKTNLLEAIFFLATSKPVHAQSEREIVDWLAVSEPIPYCRVAGQVTGQVTGQAAASDGGASSGGSGRPLELEIFLTPRGDGVNFSKQIKINGAPRRGLDLVGLLRAVLFLPEDIRLVDGAPGERRRYLDIALCQIDRAYCRGLAAYQQVVTQRNGLLRSLRESGVNPNAPAVDAQLAFWDERLVQHGAAVVARRHAFVLQLEATAQARHAELSGGREVLALHYLPSFNPGSMAEHEYEQLREGLADPVSRAPLEVETVAAAYRRKLASRRSREILAATTMYGPHRDDLRFLVNGRDLRLYGSRGQQRSAALALKLAEVRAMTAATGAAPLLLLDDVMSELDAQRRALLLQVLGDVDQAVLTTTDWDDFSPDFRASAQLLTVAGGAVQAAS
jgi:DNA replication and repair protein RecF